MRILKHPLLWFAAGYVLALFATMNSYAWPTKEWLTWVLSFLGIFFGCAGVLLGRKD